jgi:hypothetical protein
MAATSGSLTLINTIRESKGERRGEFRCADAWEVFVQLTDFVTGMPQPIVCEDIRIKKQFQLDSRPHCFVVNETVATPAMRFRAANSFDVHYIKPLKSNRDDAKSVEGIRNQIYQLRSLRGKGRKIYARGDLCFCENCCFSDYDNCLVHKDVGCGMEGGQRGRR